MKPPKVDISISGQGFYSIVAESKRAEVWMQQVQGFDGHVAHSDDTRMTQEIANAAVCNGYRVEVNGRKYLGENR